MTDTTHPPYSQVSPGMARPSVPSKPHGAPINTPAAESTPDSPTAANAGGLPPLTYRTCCELPDCTTCAGHGGYYRMTAPPCRGCDPAEGFCRTCREVERQGRTLAADAVRQLELIVWYGDMPESNGKSNFTAILMRKDGSKFDNMMDGITIDRSEYPDRVRYEADRVRYLIGELAERPLILDYDADKHSGYIPPDRPTVVGAAGQGWISVKDQLPKTEHECTSRDMMVSNSFYVRGTAVDGGEGFGMADYQEDGKWHCYGGDYDFMHIAEVTHYLSIRPTAKGAAGQEGGA